MSKNNSGTLIGGLIVGSAIGAVAGLLYAPRRGRETRQILKKSAQAIPEIAEDLSTSVQLQADRLSASALHRWDGTLTRLRDAIAAGVEATQIEAQTLQQARSNQLTSESSSSKTSK